jgi:hypothetical protein
MNLYQKISKDNRSKYGTEFEKVLKIIINQYSDRTHFIYEILQNAEDAGATHIRFRLERDRLEIYHNGRPFDERDIEGVCGIASGTKEDGTRIGLDLRLELLDLLGHGSRTEDEQTRGKRVERPGVAHLEFTDAIETVEHRSNEVHRIERGPVEGLVDEEYRSFFYEKHVLENIR